MKKFVALAAVLAALCACSEKDYYDPNYRTELYNSIWAKTFGDVNPEQTWNMATSTRADIDLSPEGITDATAQIMTGNPVHEKAYMLASVQLTGGKGSIDFDAVEGAAHVFVRVRDAAGRIVYKASCPIKGGRVSVVSGTSRSMTRAGETAYSFCGDDESVYKTSMPEGLPEISTYQTTWNGSASVPASPAYYLSSGTSTVNAHAGNCDIYIPAGEYSINEWYTRDNTNVYLLPGAHVTFNNALNENYTGNVWSVPDGASITVNNDFSYNFRLYNHGTVKASSFSLYSGGFVYNGGALETGNLALKNAESEFVTDGALTCSSVSIEGSAHFFNGGVANVSGMTMVNSNNCTWNNEGSYTTGDFTYNAGSHDVINSCKLTVNNLFKILLGDGGHDTKVFKMNGNSSLVTKDFQMGIGYIDMGAKSIIRVTGQAMMGITKADYGIYGVGTDYAVFEAKEIKGGTVSQWSAWEGTNGYMATYAGKLFVATDKHFAQGYSGTYPYYDIKDGAVVCDGGVSTAPVTIPTTNCSEGYSGTGTVTEPDPEPMPWIIACEDLGDIGDYDFNDIVFEVNHVSGSTKATITPLAAGGTLPAYITYNGNPINKELHEWFGVESRWIMVNTEHDGTNSANGMVAEPFEIDVPADFSLSRDMGGMGVLVAKSDVSHEAAYVVTAPAKGQAPQMLLLPSTWQWPKELVPIETAYPAFSSWNNNLDTGWTSSMVESQIVKRGGSNAGSNAEEVVLWQGEAVADNWSNQPTLLSDGGSELVAAGAKAGQTLCFYISPISGTSWNLQIVEGHWGSTYCDLNQDNWNLASHGGKVELVLTDEMLAAATTQKWWGGVFLLNGSNVRCTKLTLK